PFPYPTLFRSDDPGVLFTSRLDVVKVVRCPADLPLPGAASVIGIKDGSLGPDNPAAFVVDEFHVNQLVLDAALLTPPGLTAVFGVQNPSGVADDPALVLAREGHAVKHRHVVSARPGRHRQLEN